MMNYRARSFVMIMVVIAVLALLLRFLIDGLIKMNISQNESAASANLKLIAAALENYAEDNDSAYPPEFAELMKTEIPYLEKNYELNSPLKGYNYACARLEPTGYSCYASPSRCGLSGNTIFTVSTGSLLISEKCERKE